MQRKHLHYQKTTHKDLLSNTSLPKKKKKTFDSPSLEVKPSLLLKLISASLVRDSVKPSRKDKEKEEKMEQG